MKKTLLITLFIFLFTITAIAQDPTHPLPVPLPESATCMIIGLTITGATQVLKRITLICEYPKVFAGILSLLATLVPQIWGDHSNVIEIVVCILLQFATAIATYEVAKTATKDKDER